MNDFVRLPYKIYAGNSCYVPDLELDVRGTFNPSHNPGLEFSSIAAFVAYDESHQPVGRIAGIVNRKAMEGTILAHTDGGVPEVLIEVDDLTAYNVGYLIYFFWRACACSGYLLSVNPFNQPGVESYKKNMFALLGKPGYEGLTAELEAKLK